MATRIGTSNFVSIDAALRYYFKQGCDQEDVENKLDTGEITIGKPAGHGRIFADSDGRYIIEEVETHEQEAERVFGACGGKCGEAPCIAWNAEKERKARHRAARL